MHDIFLFLIMLYYQLLYGKLLIKSLFLLVDGVTSTIKEGVIVCGQSFGDIWTQQSNKYTPFEFMRVARAKKHLHLTSSLLPAHN